MLMHVQNPVPNAYTLAIGGQKPFVVVHTALLELLEPLEVQVSLPCQQCWPCKFASMHHRGRDFQLAKVSSNCQHAECIEQATAHG